MSSANLSAHSDAYLRDELRRYAGELRRRGLALPMSLEDIAKDANERSADEAAARLSARSSKRESPRTLASLRALFRRQ